MWPRQYIFQGLLCESLTQSCPIHSNSMECSPPGLSTNSPGKNTGVGDHALLQGVFPTQGLNPGFCTAGRFSTAWATREALLLNPYSEKARRRQRINVKGPAPARQGWLKLQEKRAVNTRSEETGFAACVNSQSTAVSQGLSKSVRQPLVFTTEPTWEKVTVKQ